MIVANILRESELIMAPVGVVTIRVAVKRAFLTICLLGALGEPSQTQTDARSAFDAASIRLSDPHDREMSALLNPGSFNYRNYPLQHYIALA
jgi:hypothetical protein